VWIPGCANLNPPPNDIDTGRDYTTEMCVQECIKTRDEGLAECERKYEKLRELINNDYSKEIFQLYLAMAQALENCRTSRTGTGLGSATPAAGETGTDMVKRVAGISATLKSSISTKPENSVNWASPIVYPYSEYYAETVSEYLTANKSNKPAPQTVQKQLPIQKPDEPGSEI
jgi:hypothetical protein